MAVKDGSGRFFLNCRCLDLACPSAASNLDFACPSALPAPNLLASSCSWLASCTAPVTGPPHRAKTPWQWRTDRACGPQQLQTFHLRAFLHCQLPTCLRPLAAGLRPAQLWSQDPSAGLKHHGSEGRIGPAACSPYCQTLLSELPRN